jgi:hypothetical protein
VWSVSFDLRAAMPTATGNETAHERKARAAREAEVCRRIAAAIGDIDFGDI